jgi:hypothetical protein
MPAATRQQQMNFVRESETIDVSPQNAATGRMAAGSVQQPGDTVTLRKA